MKQSLPDTVKRIARMAEPSAELFLYGSRRQADSGEASSWDFLILVDGPVDSARADRIRHLLYETASESGEEITVVVKDRQDWNSPKHRNIPLYERIRREGISL
jgi:hypothetical protein